jgi:hypothetical protein
MRINTIDIGYYRRPVMDNNIRIYYYHKEEHIYISIGSYTYALHVDPYRTETPVVLPFSYYKNITIANIPYKFSIHVFDDDMKYYTLRNNQTYYNFRNPINNQFTECEKTYDDKLGINYHYRLKNSRYYLSNVVDGSRQEPLLVIMYYQENEMYKIVIKNIQNGTIKKYIT